MNKKFVGLLFFVLFPIVALAHDDAGNSSGAAGQCVKDAKAVKNQAIADAMSVFKEKKAACLGGNSDCVESCGDTLSKTLDEIRAPLNACKEACRNSLPETRLSCREQVGCGGKGNKCRMNAEFLKCVKAPQVEAFSCVKDCKIEFRANTAAQDALKKARTDFKACLGACNP